MAAGWFILVLWVAWLALWMAMAPWVKAAAQSENAWSRLMHVGPLVLAGYLVAAPHVPIAPLNDHFAPFSSWLPAFGAGLTLVGLALAVWARVLLAGNWSGDVQLKEAHELVVDGPYRWVRHPIYTGLLVALLGTALAVGEWRGLIAMAIAAISFWRKLRLEETLMRRQFGEAYARYAKRAPALIPFVL
jgi:protein-S-isoprenylcysteine O-methyltransferase Ste14